MNPQSSNRVEKLIAQVDRIEQMLVEMLKLGNASKLAEFKAEQAMTVEQAARHLKRRPFTVREWCRKGRIKAYRATARGPYAEWRIPAESIKAYLAHGLLPPGNHAA